MHFLLYIGTQTHVLAHSIILNTVYKLNKQYNKFVGFGLFGCAYQTNQGKNTLLKAMLNAALSHR